jgi:indole-3-acetate monooxygenase
MRSGSLCLRSCERRRTIGLVDPERTAAALAVDQASDRAPGPVEAARLIAPRVAAIAAESESARRMPAALAREMARLGLFRLLVPRRLGGLEVEPSTMIDTVAEVARADGSAGWCLMIGATSGLLSAYLPEGAAREIYGDPDAITGGVFHPRGRAVVDGAALRVSGRWPFASGCQNCTWLMGGCLVFAGADERRPRAKANGSAEARLVIFPAPQAEILDTWRVSGLRGTGSHDIAVADLHAPVERSAWLADAPVQTGPLYSFPAFGLLALGIAGVTLGIARGAIDDLVTLALEKVPTGGRRPLAERSAAQAQVARAEGLVRGARAQLGDTIGSAWQRAEQGDACDLRTRALLRIAATDAVRASAQAVDLMYEAAGASAIYESSPLQRRFRDVHTATQHTMVAAPTYELAGRVLLGLETDVELL